MKINSVIVIEEDNHGLIGIAETYADVVDFLIQWKWLDEDYEVYVDSYGNTEPIKKQLGKDWKAILSKWTQTKFNEYFEGCFFLDEYKLHRAG